jgi:hypothetical protein
MHGHTLDTHQRVNSRVTGVRGFAMVVPMPDNMADPSGNTEAFRAFTEKTPQEPVQASKTPLIIGAVAVAIVVIAVIAWLAIA